MKRLYYKKMYKLYPCLKLLDSLFVTRSKFIAVPEKEMKVFELKPLGKQETPRKYCCGNLVSSRCFVMFPKVGKLGNIFWQT